MRSHWMIYKGRRVFISEFSNLGTDAAAVREECEAIKAVLEAQKPKSMLVVVNLEQTFVNDGIVQAFRDLLPYTNKYVKRRAIIGLSGFRKHFISLVTKFTGGVNFLPFDSLNEALEWVTTD